MKGFVENTGVVPDGVFYNSRIEVEYRDGKVVVWDYDPFIENNDPIIWTLEGSPHDVIRWRFVE
jgi:hypothetical protein